MKNPSEPRERRSQRDYSLPFKLAVVGEVGRGELSYKQAQRRYGIDACQAALDKALLRCSMTDGSDCYQYALAERVNGILKDEFLFVRPDAPGPFACRASRPPLQ
jgi:hypothetical protein